MTMRLLLWSLRKGQAPPPACSPTERAEGLLVLAPGLDCPSNHSKIPEPSLHAEASSSCQCLLGRLTSRESNHLSSLASIASADPDAPSGPPASIDAFMGCVARLATSHWRNCGAITDSRCVAFRLDRPPPIR